MSWKYTGIGEISLMSPEFPRNFGQISYGGFLMGSFDQLCFTGAINERYLPRYKTEAGLLGDDLIYLHTHLNLISQLNDFDSDLFAPSVALLLNYLGQLLLTECVLICTRLWKDKRSDTLTLDRFATWLLDRAVRPQFRKKEAKQKGKTTCVALHGDLCYYHCLTPNLAVEG